MKKILVMFTMMMVAMVTFAKDIKTVVFTTTPQMHCAACENKIKSNLRFEKGIKSIETSVNEMLRICKISYVERFNCIS